MKSSTKTVKNRRGGGWASESGSLTRLTGNKKTRVRTPVTMYIAYGIFICSSFYFFFFFTSVHTLYDDSEASVVRILVPTLLTDSDCCHKSLPLIYAITKTRYLQNRGPQLLVHQKAWGVALRRRPELLGEPKAYAPRK